MGWNNAAPRKLLKLGRAEGFTLENFKKGHSLFTWNSLRLQIVIQKNLDHFKNNEKYLEVCWKKPRKF